MDTHHTSGYTSACDDSFVIVFSRSLQCILQILRSTRSSDVEQRRFEAAKGKLPVSNAASVVCGRGDKRISKLFPFLFEFPFRFFVLCVAEGFFFALLRRFRAISRIGFSQAFYTENSFAGFSSLFYELLLQRLDLLSEPGLALGLGHGLVIRERRAVPLRPSEVVFQSVSLFGRTAGGPIGVVVNVPEAKGLSFGLMMIRCEKGRIRRVLDEIVLGHVGEGVEELVLCLFIADTGMGSRSRREQRPFPVQQSIDASGDETEGGPEEGNDIVELGFRSGEADMKVIDVSLKAVNGYRKSAKRSADGGAEDIDDAGLWDEIILGIEGGRRR